jgi:hypothetical protein
VCSTDEVKVKRESSDALAVPVGEPFWYIGRAVDLVWLGFGPLGRKRKPLGGSDVLGRFALHLQCPWRISGPRGIVVGGHDIYSPASTARLRGWKWEKGPTLFDERVEAHLAKSLRPLAFVRRVGTDRCGGFRLSMSNALVLEVFPDGSEATEYSEWWRVFRPGTKAPHFVMSHSDVSS